MNTRSTNVKKLVAQIARAIALTCAAGASADAAAPDTQFCRQGDRGRLLGYEKVGAYPTAHDARAHFEEWIAFYQDFFNFPPNLPVTFQYGFDSYKVTYCTDDAVLPGQSFGNTTTATGMVSVPRTSGPLPTVAYVHGTSMSFYDAPSNPNTFGTFNPRGESFEGPPSTAVFAGNGFIYIAPDYLGLGDSTVPRHRYFHADTEASSAIDLLAAAQRRARRPEGQAERQALRLRLLAGWTFSACPAARAGTEAREGRRHGRRRRGLRRRAIFLTAWRARRPFVSRCTSVTCSSRSMTSTTSTTPLPTSSGSRYAAIVEDLFDMRHFFDDIAAELPPPASDLLTPRTYAELRRTATRRCASACGRTPWIGCGRWRRCASTTARSTKRCRIDVTLVSVERLRRRGATIDVRTLPGLDHVNSWIQALPRAVRWFREVGMK